MDNYVIKRLGILYVLVQVAIPALGQDYPPHLRDKQQPGVSLYAGFEQRTDSAMVVTVKFKLTETGFLDSLYVSPNAPKDYYGKIHRQLLALDGRWQPRLEGGKPVPSKWFIYRYYVMGPYTRKSTVPWRTVEEAYKRDYDLFRCFNAVDRAVNCITPYVEGPDFYLFPPEWYGTDR